MLATRGPENEEENKEFKSYKEGFVHIDIKYLPTINGEKNYLFVAIDRATRLVLINIYSDKTAKSSGLFLEKVIDFFPFHIHKILTDNGTEFTDKFTSKDKKPTGNHIFDKICKENNTEHRLTKPYTPKTNGMVERVNRKVNENVLKKIKFKNTKEMKETIFHYFHKYNHYIKHSGIGRKTPMEMVEKLYIDKRAKLKYTLEEFREKIDVIFSPYITGPHKKQCPKFLYIPKVFLSHLL